MKSCITVIGKYEYLIQKNVIDPKTIVPPNVVSLAIMLPFIIVFNILTCKHLQHTQNFIKLLIPRTFFISSLLFLHYLEFPGNSSRSFVLLSSHRRVTIAAKSDEPHSQKYQKKKQTIVRRKKFQRPRTNNHVFRKSRRKAKPSGAHF